MSEFGIPLDARPAKHGGSQRMMLDDVKFKFKLRHCMVHFVHRAPTKKEIEEMTPLVLTQGETPWNPRSEEHSSSESDAFELEVAQQLCQTGWCKDVTLDDCTE